MFKRDKLGFKSKAFRRAIRITLIYFLFGCAWIIFSDIIVNNLYIGNKDIFIINIVKGLLYVISTAVLIFLLTYPSFRKITRATEDIQLERDNAKLYLEISGSIIVLTDKTMIINSINRKGCEILKLDKDEIIGKNWLDFVPEKNREEYKESLMYLLNKSNQNYIPHELSIIDSGGTEKTISFSSVLLENYDQGEPEILSSGIDITERKKLEEQRLLLEAQLRNQQKLESIGTLASGVAHEINNPINGILNYGQVILDSTRPDTDINSFAKEIINETNRVAEIVKNLLNFSRQSGKQHSYAQIEDIVSSTLSLVRTIFKNDNITLNVDIEENIPSLKCRSQQIQQVLMNLLTNARDSLKEKYPGHHENKKIDIECHKFIKNERDWVSISVEDMGTGIEERIKDRIFDPFFTTKGKNKGTGLGLSISYGIIKEHHGDILVDSAEGEYTKFTVLLPSDYGLDMDDSENM